MAGQVVSNWDVFFRVWAIVGPLLAGGISQVWERRNKESDRMFKDEREKNKEEIALKMKEAETLTEKREQRVQEVKSCFLRFMSSSHEYVGKQSQHLTDLSKYDTRDKASDANDRFISSLQEVTLISPTVVEEAALTYFNATLKIPRPYNLPADDEYLANIATYQQTRATFNQLAKNLLSVLEGN